MTTSYSSIKDIVSITKIGRDLFQNTYPPTVPFRGRSVFGGTICAQALYSAIKTIPQERFVPHSLHSYFLLGGNPNHPIQYKVENIRDGGSFLTREVKAYQKDKVIFTQKCSFTLKSPKKILNPQPKHSKSFNGFIDLFNTKFFSARESFQKGVLDKNLLNFPPNSKPLINDWLDQLVNINIDLRFKPSYWSYGIDSNHPDRNKKPNEIKLDFFWKALEPIEDEMLNYVVLVYISDGLFLSQSGKFHGRPGWNCLISATIDHSIYFHKPFKANDWSLYHIEQPKSGDSRILMEGGFYGKDQSLFATVFQEGLVSLPEQSIEKYKDFYVERVLAEGKSLQSIKKVKSML